MKRKGPYRRHNRLMSVFPVNFALMPRVGMPSQKPAGQSLSRMMELRTRLAEASKGASA